MTKIIAGIDYSMSCPALCIHKGSSFHFDNCKFYFITDVKKYVRVFDYNITGIEFPPYTSDEQRFDIISTEFVGKIKEAKVDAVGLEGYAMGAKGRVFQIGENTGVLKHKLWKQNVQFEVFPPTVIKKMATSKGNSDKAAMFQAFFDETKIDLKCVMGYNKTKVESPIGDIIDSYFICKHTFTNF